MSDVAVTWVEELHENGKLYFRVGRAGHRFVAEWAGVCTLYASRDGHDSELVPAPGADPELVDKLHRGLAKALLRHLQGKLTLHASAAAFDGVAIACMGESEAGKSTLGAALVGLGGALVADDTLAIEFGEDGAVSVSPTERVSWLLSDSCEALGFSGRDDGKIAIEAPRRTTSPVRLAALVSLTFDDELERPSLRRLRGHEALAKMVGSVVRFVLDEPERNRGELEQLIRLSESVPVYELARPWRLDQIGSTAEVLVELVRGRSNGDKP
jgi:hypothetical protein